MKFFLFIFIFLTCAITAQTKPVKKAQPVKKNKTVAQKKDTILGVIGMDIKVEDAVAPQQTLNGEKNEQVLTNGIPSEYGVPPQQVEQINSNEIFAVVEEMPEYPGGQDELKKDLVLAMKHTEQTKTAIGKCFAKFTVDKTGAIKDVVILKGISGCTDCNKVAIDAIMKLKNFKPGKQNGNPVNVAFNIPIKFN
jgi:protein TonB